MRGIYRGKRITGSAQNIILMVALAPPILLIVLFEVLRGNSEIMEQWTTNILRPVAQFLGRMWSWAPFSVGEMLTCLVAVALAAWTVRALVRVAMDRDWKGLLRRLAVVLAAVLWVQAGLNWMWNATYYAQTFTQKSGLDTSPYSVEELAEVTMLFAQKAAEYSTQVERDENGNFAVSRDDCLDRGLTIYKNLEAEFPFLAMESVRAKPLALSKLQSILGFTGIYFPFTGEANVNVDFPAALLPATIAHEMSHQRMVASEQEANFVGIAASVNSDDEVYQYSGYLFGLIELCNALYGVDAERWYAIAGEYFTPEMTVDWNANNNYWLALESPVEDAATQAYDSYLKGNDQTLGIRSYGACVDLLVAYYG